MRYYRFLSRSKEKLWHKQILWGKKDSPVGTTVFYELENGRIRLTNMCYQNSFSGKLQKITGVATPTDSSNSKLKVKFDPLVLRPFSFDYWIIDIDPDYKLALLGTPDRKSLSILSRTPKPDQELLDKALQKAIQEGFDPKTLKSIPQQDTK